MNQATANCAEIIEEEARGYFQNEENFWKSSFSKPKDKELLTIFPEAKRIIPQKIAEWTAERDEFSDIIKKKLLIIREETSNEQSRWFWRTWIKYTDGAKIIEINKQLSRLKRLLAISKGYKSDKGISEEQIQAALAVPIQELAGFPLRNSGRSLTGLCPLHDDKRPSFNIYPETNSFWCFGCQQGGNSINFIRLIYGYSFKEAVLFLIKQ